MFSSMCRIENDVSTCIFSCLFSCNITTVTLWSALRVYLLSLVIVMANINVVLQGQLVDALVLIHLCTLLTLPLSTVADREMTFLRRLTLRCLLALYHIVSSVNPCSYSSCHKVTLLGVLDFVFIFLFKQRWHIPRRMAPF